ncbi:MAG: TetR/AcrR family transcriptional regulator [Acidimicrobiales bacterium]|nr:TetR/AcrR family transcriptional regulator [Acidimicrobiales bacterium]
MPRIQAGSVAEHRTLMEGRLLDAFGELLAEQGYGDTTLADVAARSGMARNTVYNYVADKESLLHGYMDREVRRFLEDVEASVAAAPDAPSRLEVFVRAQVRYFATSPSAGHDLVVLLGAERYSALMAHLRPARQVVTAIVQEGIGSGDFRPIDVDSALTLAFACMSADRIPLARGEADPDVVADRTVDFLLHALRAG